jgi:hypothetical protein
MMASRPPAAPLPWTSEPIHTEDTGTVQQPVNVDEP